MGTLLSISTVNLCHLKLLSVKVSPEGSGSSLALPVGVDVGVCVGVLVGVAVGACVKCCGNCLQVV